MIRVFANHDMGNEAISLFDDMLEKNINRDGATFLAILRACSHGGLVVEGRRYFKQMVEHYEIQPTEEHYAVMVEIFANHGNFREVSMKFLKLFVRLYSEYLVWILKL